MLTHLFGVNNPTSSVASGAILKAKPLSNEIVAFSQALTCIELMRGLRETQSLHTAGQVM